MPRGLFNWTYRDVIDFISENGFIFYKQREGSHEYWINESTKAVVDINFHGQKSFRPRTFETMIRQSKVSKKVWREWTSR